MHPISYYRIKNINARKISFFILVLKKSDRIKRKEGKSRNGT